MVTVLYAHQDKELPRETWLRLLRTLPEHLQKQIVRYRRWQDRQAGLLGKLLLKEWLQEHGYDRDCLDRLVLDRYSRPRLDRSIDFNISHSGEYVVCVVSGRGNVGVDIEPVRSIDLADFEGYMPLAQWKAINGSKDPYRSFFRYWTQYESIIKAEGRGLSVPLKDIYLDGDTAVLYGDTWFLREIFVSSDYLCHIATSHKVSEVVVHKSGVNASV